MLEMQQDKQEMLKEEQILEDLLDLLEDNKELQKLKLTDCYI